MVHRVPDAHGERRRAQSARLPRCRIEELETRVLLSGYNTQQPGHFMTFELPFDSAEISPIARPLIFVQRQLNLTSSSGTDAVTSVSSSQWPSLADASMSAPNDPPLVVLVHHPLLADAEATSSGAAGDPSTSFDDGHSVPLIAVSSNDSSASGASDYSSSVNDAALETTAGSATTAPAVFLVPSNSGSGWIALQSIAVGPVDAPSGHFDGPQLPVQFNGSFAQLRGTLDASQPAMSYEIPIGPSTQSLGVSVRPASDMPPGEVPVIDGMSLVDSTGNTLEQVSPADDSGGSQSAAVLVQLHDPPAGDRIVVDIGAVEPTSSSPSPTSSTSSGLGSGVVTTPPLSQSASWSVPFVLDVQRQQQSSVSTADALSVVPGTDTIGTLIVASAQPPVLFASSSAPSAPAEQDGSTSLYVQPTNTAAAQASASETESTDSFNLRVPTGPLASRSGGALGPTWPSSMPRQRSPSIASSER